MSLVLPMRFAAFPGSWGQVSDLSQGIQVKEHSNLLDEHRQRNTVSFELMAAHIIAVFYSLH
jgi:hypothetical protein